MILMGTGPFAVPSFESIRDAGHAIALVVTRPTPAVKSRGGPPPTPVRDWASAHDLAIADPDSINSPTAIDELRQHEADLLVVCDYGQILKPDALATTRWGGINLHGSLLPAYRGAAPVQRAMLAGETQTGVSVIHMTPKLDGGPILTTRVTPIRDEETAGELEARLARIGVEATLEAIESLARYDPPDAVGLPQDPTRVSQAPRLSKAEGQIDWSQSGRMIDVHVRGMQPWPVAFTHMALNESKPPLRLAIRRVHHEIDPTVTADQAGIVLPSDGLVVGCGDGRVRIERLQPAGKNEMTGDEFVRGHRPPPGTRLA